MKGTLLPFIFLLPSKGASAAEPQWGGDITSMETEPTGMSELDFITGDPMPNGQTIIIGAPGTGKKVVALQMAMHRARQEKDASIGSAQSSIRNEVPTIRAFTCLL